MKVFEERNDDEAVSDWKVSYKTRTRFHDIPFPNSNLRGSEEMGDVQKEKFL